MIQGAQPVDILLVEDSEEDAELTMRALKKRNLVNRVHRVRDGAAALDYLFARGEYEERDSSHWLRLMLLDLKLPKVNGLEVLREVRASELTRHLPVAVLTSSREDSDLAEAYRLGANSYIVKPVDFDRFSETVSQLGMYWAVLNEPPSRR